ncbi:MAG TPA: hypothetical protein VFA33_24160 [Bryobacteraceae bacterium]|nr:hypothetical protein [Bryobacteraceae bacterium]
MELSRLRWVAPFFVMGSLLGAVPPAQWVPARWHWTDPSTLDLLAGSPINCLLLKSYNPAFVQKAAERGIATLAVLTPGVDPAEAARQAVQAKLQGVVLEGDFPDAAAERVKDLLAGSHAVVVQLTARNKMKLGGPDPIVGTYQGVWPGIQVAENGEAKAAPSGNPWIDTNSGFIRSVRVWGSPAIWIGNLPPERTIVTGQRYLQVISDAEVYGARWIVALDQDFANRLQHGDAAARQDWQRIGQYLKYFEDHRDWRSWSPYGQLAVVQDPKNGGLLSGGIIDMIAAKHTPVRPVPLALLSQDSLKGASMAVDVDPQALTPAQRAVLQSFTRGGGTLLSGPPGWKDSVAGNSITLDKAELDRLNDIWHDVQSMIGRKNLGARLFNVASMLSFLESSPDGKQVVVHLINYSGYPIENVTVHMLSEYHHARLITPEGVRKDLELYKTEEGSGVDIDAVSVCATLELD